MRTIEEKTALGRGPRELSLPALPRRWRFWRSPAGQPPFARPALLVTAGLAAFAYAWGANNANLEPFYGAAARSMSMSWHDFLFGAFDPAGTVTVDKLPGALWLQALSLRVIGFHVWAVVLPQILEGVLTILVLYRVVRRLAGAVAGLTAAVVLAVSPVTVALSRGNVSDSLLILLTVLAADATSDALLRGRLRSLLLAGVFVGLAFQAKMMQAWLILPALAAAYLVAAPLPLRRRVGDVALAGVLTVVVSLSWMSVVSLVPAGERPYVDGTQNDSLFSQVFDYNGIARFGGRDSDGGAGSPAPFLLEQVEAGQTLNNQTARIKPSWHRLLSGPLGRDDGWLLPAALISAIVVLLRRRRTGRRDRLRAAVVLWGTWLLLLATAFSVGRYLNSYYLAALSPAIAALCGVGVALFWEERHRQQARIGLAAGVVISAGYGAYLLHGGSHVPAWMLPAAICFAIAGTAIVLNAARLRGDRRSAGISTALVVACALPLAAGTSALAVTRGLGPFDAPYTSMPTGTGSRISPQRYATAAQLTVARFLSTYKTPIAFSTDTSLLAAPFIFYTGKEILPIGGYKGGVPAPSLSQLQHYIASGEVRVFLIPAKPPSHDPRIIWIQTHCTPRKRPGRRREIELTFYLCHPASA
jgi:4-amino-4-deoxy-L-arabinose transferase-like glycosyltransferase